jgi:hypothetical protein
MIEFIRIRLRVCSLSLSVLSEAFLLGEETGR